MKPLGETPGYEAARILVVDDDAGVRDVAVRALRYEKLDASSVACGEDAIDRVRATQVDCVVLDLTMPSMSGPDTFRALRALRPSLPIVLCSGWQTEEVDTLVGGDTRCLFLRKPFTPRQLAAAVESVLQG